MLLGDHRLDWMKTAASLGSEGQQFHALCDPWLVVTDMKNDISITRGKLRTLTAVVS